MVQRVLDLVITIYLWHAELTRQGEGVDGGVNSESVRLTRSSRSLDTHPLRAFIMTFICSFIAFISAIIGGGAVSVREGRLTFCRSDLLGALLAWGPS